MSMHIKTITIFSILALTSIAALALNGCGDGCSQVRDGDGVVSGSKSSSSGAAATNNAASDQSVPPGGASVKNVDKPRTSAATPLIGPPVHTSTYSGSPLPDEAREVATKVVAQLAQPRTIDASLVAAPWVTKYGRVDNPAMVLDAAKQAYRDGRRDATSARVRGVKACPANRPMDEILATIGASKGRPGLEKMIELGQTMPEAWIVWCDMAYTSGKSLIMDENIVLVSRMTGGFKVHGVD